MAGGGKPGPVEQHRPSGQARRPPRLSVLQVVLMAALLGLLIGITVGLISLLI
jgi:hypothetical protein